MEYVIWSNEHQAWWRPASRGYTRYLEDAGRYGGDEADLICKGAGEMETIEGIGRRRCEIMLVAPERMADLLQGKSVILPADRKHAEAMSVVAEAFLKPQS